MATFGERDGRLSFGAVLDSLKAAGEETRLRVLALLAEGELSVSDITDILGQSQPRISRHLKLMLEAGLIERKREGAFAFFTLARGALGGFARDLVARIAAGDATLRADRGRLVAVRQMRMKAAEAYFSRHAVEWDRLRSLHVAEEAVESAVVALLGNRPIGALLELGAGTGHMLRLLAPRVRRAVGVDLSHAMLAVARANLAKAGLRDVELYQGDITALNAVEHNAFDLVVIHQVLHYLDDPARAIREAAAALRPSGRLLVVDFAPHEIGDLREKHAHRRLGFAREEIAGYLAESGLELEAQQDLPPPDGDRQKLTVSLWLGRDRRMITDAPLTHTDFEVA
jgi:ubiquinone/menaquinone biosynthesis C-methylase UbiE